MALATARWWAVLSCFIFEFYLVELALAADLGNLTDCPDNCVCTSQEFAVNVDCSRQNLTSIPRGLRPNTSQLDLSMNNISQLPDYAFVNLVNLQELRLVGNQLKNLPPNVFSGIKKLRILYLQGNEFTMVPAEAFKGLSSLEQLHLDANHISTVPDDSFEDMLSLKRLWLDSNELKAIPVKALGKARAIDVLWLSVNKISHVPNHAFSNNSRLAVLLLHNNCIATIGDDAFAGLNDLRILEINENKLTHIPVSLDDLANLDDLTLADNSIEYLPDQSFENNKKLVLLQLKGNPIASVGMKVFSNLPKLERLILSEARDQEVFPDLTGSSNLQVLGFDRASIESIPADLCTTLPELLSFDIHSNRISEIPDLSKCTNLRILNLGNNKLTSMQGEPFCGLSELRDLTLSHNYISTVPQWAFSGLDRLQYLDLMHNRISEIHEDAFVSLTQLEDLNLGENQFPVLPTKGLSNLKNLKTFHNAEMQEFPAPDVFPNIQLLTLSYAYHCCEFIQSPDEENHNKIELEEDIHWLINEDDYDKSLLQNLTNMWKPLDNLSISQEDLAQNIYESFGTDYDYEIPASAEEYFTDYKQREYAEDIVLAKPPIECKPLPGPFMPCVDLFGCWLLRCGVWLVFLLAVLGNGVVLFVSVTSRSKMDVPRFLICNLACADFFMGIYLGFLAIVDASTLGEFKKHAIKWQTSPGCLIAGFLGVLSSELSVFTLTVITLERFYAITHAMQLNKRLSLKRAGYIMIGGWLFSIFVATLPLFGISDYRKFAVCLPFEISDTVSLGYVCFIMLFNGVSFSVIVSCYMKMYCSIRGSHAWNSNDSRVAKRMALLVFTDFACWAPITFFSLTAAFGKELISLDDAKIFTIFVLPLNSCANPFLYAILTKQFKKDCVRLCKRLEETTVSRHLTRISNRNVSSWSSSRRPSGANSFFNAEKQGSCSNSVSNGGVNYNVDNSGSRTGTTWMSSTARGSGSSRGSTSQGNTAGGSGKASSIRQCNVCMHVIKESHTTPAEEEMLEELHKNVIESERNSRELSRSDHSSADMDFNSEGATAGQDPSDNIKTNSVELQSLTNSQGGTCPEYRDVELQVDSLSDIEDEKETPLLSGDTERVTAERPSTIQELAEEAEEVEYEFLGAEGGWEGGGRGGTGGASACVCPDSSPCSNSSTKSLENKSTHQKAKSKNCISEYPHETRDQSRSLSHSTTWHSDLTVASSPTTVLYPQCPCQKSSICYDSFLCSHQNKDLTTILEKQLLKNSESEHTSDRRKHFVKQHDTTESIPAHKEKGLWNFSRIASGFTKGNKSKYKSNSYSDLSHKSASHYGTIVSNPKRHSFTVDYFDWMENLEFRDSAFVEDENFDKNSEVSNQSCPDERPVESQQVCNHGNRVICDETSPTEGAERLSRESMDILQEKRLAVKAQTVESNRGLDSAAEGASQVVTLSRSFDRESGFSSDD